MKTIILTFACVFFISLTAFGQSEYFFPEVGTVLTYNNYDAKGKLQKDGWITQTFSKVEKKGNAIIILVTLDWKTKQKDLKDIPGEMKDAFDNLEFRIVNDTIYMDFMGSMMSRMTAFMQSQMGGQGKITVSGSGKMAFPGKLAVGMTLPDAEPFKMVTSVSVQGMNLESTSITRCYNGKVEAEETVTTPAGKFECFRISNDYEGTQDMMMRKITIKNKNISWMCPGIGTAKTETYDAKGKFQGSMLLEKIEKK